MNFNRHQTSKFSGIKKCRPVTTITKLIKKTFSNSDCEPILSTIACFTHGPPINPSPEFKPTKTLYSIFRTKSQSQNMVEYRTDYESSISNISFDMSSISILLEEEADSHTQNIKDMEPANDHPIKRDNRTIGPSPLYVLTAGLKNPADSSQKPDSTSMSEKRNTLRKALNGLNTCNRKRTSFLNAFKHTRSSILQLEYFQGVCKDSEYKTRNSFQSYNDDDFQSIRHYRGVKEDEFKHSFDSAINQGQPKTYDGRRSNDGRYRIHFLGPREAHFLHKSVKMVKNYLANHRNSKLQIYVGLYRIGKEFCAIEDLGIEKRELEYSLCVNNSIKSMKEIWRNINHPGNFLKFRNERKILLRDIRFLKKLSIDCYNLGIEVTDK